MRKISLVLLWTLFSFTSCNSPSANIEKAFAMETAGNYQNALHIYAQVAKDVAPSTSIPDAQKGKILQPKIWVNEIEKYLEWSRTSEPKPNTYLSSALSGIERCMKKTELENYVLRPTLKSLSPEFFTENWNKAFTPPPPGAADWNSLTSEAQANSVSLVQIQSSKSYSYEFSLINRSTSRCIEFSLYPESKVYIPVPPGEYMALCKSSVTFQPGQLWNSSYSAFPLSVPEKSSLISMEIKTKVPRK